MAGANTEIVEEICRSADSGAWEEAFALFRRDFRLRELSDPAEGEVVLQGAKAIRALRKRWEELHGQFSQRERQCVQTGQWVICDTLWRSPADDEGTGSEMRTADVFEIVDGQIACVRTAILHAWTAAEPR